MDVVDLRDFYASDIGQVSRRMIRKRLRKLWPDVKGMRVMGLGYATPYLGLFRHEAERTLAFMPSLQGVLHWPLNGDDKNGNLTALIDSAEIPLPDNSIDRLLVVHALEFSDQLGPMMREIWRVLDSGGKLMIVVPNRSGLWARFEHTPFGHGHPYSTRQLSKLVRDTLFTPTHKTGALFVPPAHSRLLRGWAPAWEKIGLRWFSTFSGVLMMEATKQIYATPPALKVERKRLYIPVPKGAQKGVPRFPRNSNGSG